MLRAALLQSLSDVAPAAWDRLVGTNNPFVCHAFLHALETSGSVGHPDTGWVPRHVVVYADQHLVGAMPLYEKYDSYGEYIFDWGWARAAQANGIPYYPKLVSAIPFTPATGPRLLIAPDLPAGIDGSAVQDTLLRCVRDAAQTLSASSIHVLFAQSAELPVLARHGLMERLSYQFHWQRDPAWHTFDDFLAALRAPVRKQVRRERARAQSHGLTLTMRRGTELTDSDWQALYRFYQQTTVEKRAIAYLTPAFFTALRHTMAHGVVAAMAHAGDQPVAGSLFLTRGTHLYGRYWGSLAAYDALHFELCYYAPMAWALAHGIDHFEAGAQGEHKLKRGLLPSACHSGHWIRHPGLARAIGEFLTTESAALGAEMAAMVAHSPFHRTSKP